MYDNRNWVWNFQNKPVIKTLYDGMFGIVSSASSEDVKSIIDVKTSNMAALKAFASFYNIRVVGGIITDAVVWNETNWNDENKFWNGKNTGQDEDFFRQYIQMKTFIFGKPICLQTIKDALDVLFDGIAPRYTCNVVESGYGFEIKIRTFSEYVDSILKTALSIDPEPFGKISGYSYKITIR